VDKASPRVGVLFWENKVALVFYPGVHPCTVGAGQVGEKLGEEGCVGCVIIRNTVHGGGGLPLSSWGGVCRRETTLLPGSDGGQIQ